MLDAIVGEGAIGEGVVADAAGDDSFSQVVNILPVERDGRSLPVPRVPAVASVTLEGLAG